MGFNDINLQVSGPQQPASIYKTKVLKGQVPFAVQVTEPNTKYVIKHNFELDGDVTIPENCILEFDGGSLSDGTITGNNTILIYTKIEEINVRLRGTFYNKENRKLHNYLKLPKKYGVENIKLTFASGHWTSDSVLDPTFIEETLQYGIDEFGIILGVACASGSTDVHINCDEDRLINDLISNGYTSISYLKFHIDGGIWEQDRSNVTAFSNYADVVVATVQKFINAGISFNDVYVINEWTQVSNRGVSANLKDVTLSLISRVKALNKRVGISYSMENFWISDDDIFEELDIPALNYYPTLSYADENATDDMDFTENVFRSLRDYKLALRKKHPNTPFIITESGCPPYTKSLRAPYSKLGNLIDGHSPQMHVFFKSVLNNISNPYFNIEMFGFWYSSSFNKVDISNLIKSLFYE